MSVFKKVILILILAILIVFASQNFEAATIRFLKWQIDMPIAVILLGIYGLGAVTGGFVFSGLRIIFKNSSGKKATEQKNLDETGKETEV
ncbi:MAG: LapA family protein [Bacteroidales bacterium]|jgi:uncharacterized integral membrane protein|nr:LapA family protein [Bacteroidales bacterium]